MRKMLTDKEIEDNFKKLCERRHRWDDGWVCSKCGVRKADWVEAKKEEVKLKKLQKPLDKL